MFYMSTNSIRFQMTTKKRTNIRRTPFKPESSLMVEHGSDELSYLKKQVEVATHLHNKRQFSKTKVDYTQLTITRYKDGRNAQNYLEIVR